MARHQGGGLILTKRDRAIARHDRYLQLADEARRRHDYTGCLRYALQAHHAMPGGIRPIRIAAEVLWALGLYDRAVERWAEYTDALTRIQATPAQRSEAWYNFGVVLRDAGALELSRHAQLQAVMADDANGMAWNELGNLSIECNDADDAIEVAYQKAATCPVIGPDARWNLAYRLLSVGRYAEAWPHWLARWESTFFLSEHGRDIAAPRWDGAPVTTLLLISEQGLGDMIQMLRYLPAVSKRAERVILEVREPLHALVRENFPDVLTIPYRAGYPACDAWCSLFDLPAIEGTTLDDLPGEPYLRVVPDATLDRSLRIGVCWSGSTQTKHDRRRSSALSEWEPILATPGVTFHSLQIERPAEHPNIVPAPVWPSLLECAQFMASLDLVITVDTVYAHLAGAMGIPVWVMVPRLADWRWGTAGTQGIWYRSATVYRQAKAYDWSAPMKAAALDLHALTHGQQAA